MKTKTTLKAGSVPGKLSLVVSSLVAALAVALSGCATQPPPARPVVASYSWHDLPRGAVGIVATSSTPTFLVSYPMSKQEATTAGGKNGFWLGGKPGNAGALCLVQGTMGYGLVVLVAGSVAGQAVGAVRGVSAGKLQQAQLTLRKAEAAIDFQEALRAKVFQRLNGQVPRTVLVVPKPLPPGIESECRTMTCFMAGTLAWVPEYQTRQAYLGGHGVETMLEIRVNEPGLRGHSGVNPSLSLGADVEARLVRLSDGHLLANSFAHYTSAGRRFTQWADDDARLLREEFARCCDALSRDLVRGLTNGAASEPPRFPIGGTLAVFP